MSAIHTLYKQFCHKWLVITLLCTTLFGASVSVHADNEVMVSLSSLYDIMPPEASVYKETPEKFFVVNINNPQDHILTIYLTLKLEKMTGEKFIMEQKVSAMPKNPMFAITLPASTSITLTNDQLHNHFRHLALKDFNITGTLLGDVMSNSFGLLPEGDYMATLTAYPYLPGEKVNEKTKEAISDPKLSTTHFKICYTVKAPELKVPMGVVKPTDPDAEEKPKQTFAGVEYDIPDINFGNVNTWNWLHLMEVCGQLPNMNYELEFYSMKNGSKGYYTSPENAILQGRDRVLLYPDGLSHPKLRNVQSATFSVPNPKSYFQEGEYYAVRVHSYLDKSTELKSGDPKVATYRMLENDGYSRPIVVRVVYEGVNADTPEVPKKEVNATVTHPKLTFPDNEGNCFGPVYLEAKKDYEATWEKPEFVEGDREFAEKFDYTYNINIYKAPDDAATFDDIIKEGNEPLYTVTELKFEKDQPLKHTVPWKKLQEDNDDITLGGHYFIEVTANPVPKPGEGQLLFCARGQNCCTYTMFLTEDIIYEDCGALVEYEDKKVVSHGETIEKKRAEMNGFNVVFTNLKATDEAKTTYSGTGYVKWQPFDLGCYIAMSFTGIRLNKDMQVIAGTGTARKMENSDVIPYDLIDYAAAKAGNWVQNTDAYKSISAAASQVGEAFQKSKEWVDVATGGGASEAQQSVNDKVQALYDAHVTKWRDPDEVAKACGDYWTKYVMPARNYGNTVMNWIQSGSYNDVDVDASPTFLPIGLPQSFLPDSLDMDFQVMKFDISPTRASVGVAAFFYMPDGVRIDKAGEEVKDGTRLSSVLAFVAPRLCVKPQEIWAKEGEFGLLYDFSIKDMGTGYTFTFLAPTDYTKLNDGCAIHWEQVKGQTKVNMMVLDAKMTIPGLLNEDRSRTAELRLGARIDNWSDWLAWITMDPFQVEDLDGYVFNVIGANGIRLDHSRVKNPDLKDKDGAPTKISAIFKDVRRGDDSGKTGYDWAHPKLGFKGIPDGEDPMNWMGLYIDEISMTFPKALRISDKKEDEDKGLKLGLRNLLWDKSGVSLTAFIGSEGNPVVDLKTGRLGGWALSLDEVAVNVLQGNFSDCHFNGMFEVPLLKGTFDYECKMNYVVGEELGKLYEQHNIAGGNNDEKKFHLTFTTQQRDEMNLDFWMGDVNIDKDGSWFNIDYLDGDTQVEFMASGTITLGEANETKTGGRVGDLPFDIPGVRFAGLRLANYKYDTSRDFAETYAKKLAEGTYKDKSKAFDAGTFQAGLNKTLEKADFQSDDADVPFYFNIGRWSLASAEKSMWGFPLRVKDIGVETDTDNERIALKFVGELGLVGNGKDTDGDGEDDSWALTAGAGMKIWANYKFNGFKDLASTELTYDTFEFDSLYFDGSFGGGLCTVKGTLCWTDTDKEKGFKGDLTLGVKELFDVTVAGGIWEMKKENYKNGYFYANVGDMNIPCGPTGVVITRLSCGFFWNRTMPADAKLDDKEKFREAMASGGIARNKAFGLTFGMGLSFANETLCSGDFNGFMAYDLKNDALSRLTLLGDMDALKGPEAKKGLLHALVKIDYVDNVAEVQTAKEKMTSGDKNVTAVDRCQSFTLNATVDFKADTKEALDQFLGEGTMEKLEGTLNEAAKAVKDSGMEEFSADKADDDNKGDGKTSGKDGAKDNLTASAGASFSFEFQLRHYRDKKETKWHVYLGEPSRSKRCEVVFIDFKFDAKLLKVWAKKYLNAYLCLGNELPKDENGVMGGLPALPDKLVKILDGNGGQSENVETNTGSTANLQAERAKQIQSGPSGAGIKGGIQFGAEAGAEFGVEIPIGYVTAGALIGFDAILKQYGDCACSDGSKLGGKNGFYAMAQLYAALWGSAGVRLNFGFWSGDFPLVDVAFGAVLKGGFPNPSWVYGKMRVKGKVLSGLISFNKAMELRMGKVCVPEVSSPLDNIDIFSSYTVGDENKDVGWGKKGDGTGAEPHDPYVMPSFTTNMNMDSHLRLVDENELNTKAGLDGDTRAAQASSTKTFVFHLEHKATLQAYSDGGAEQGAPKYCDMTPAQNSRTSFTVNTGTFDQEKNYMLHVRGFVKQIIDGREQDPIIRNLQTHKDEQKPWGQDLDLYFRTGKWSDDLSQEVMLFMPFDETGVILQDAGNPYFSIANDRQDMFNSPDKEWYVNMEENLGTTRSPRWGYPDIRYDAAGYRQTSEQSKWEHIGIELTTEYDGDSKFHTVGLVTPPGTTATIKKNTQYRFSLYSVDKKQMNDDLNKIKEARKAIVSGKADVIETLTLLAYDENGKMTELGKDMMAWYTEQTSADNDFSNSLDHMDQIINDFEKEKLSDLRYTSLEFQRVFTTGSCNTFAEKLNSTDKIYSSQTLKFKENTVTREGGTITARMKEGYNQLSTYRGINPYRMLNWWVEKACAIMMPAYRLTSYKGDEKFYYTLNAPLIIYQFSPEWHGNHVPTSKIWNDEDFEKEVSPFFATKWRPQSSNTAVSGQTLCKNMVDSVCKVLYADGKLAAEMPSKLRTSWNIFESKALGGNKTNGVNQIRDKKVDWGWIWDEARNYWREPESIENLRSYNREVYRNEDKAYGYAKAFKRNDTKWVFPLSQMLCIFTLDVYNNASFRPIWDHYTVHAELDYTGGINENTSPNVKKTWPGTVKRDPTRAIYWIAGETAPDKSKYPFNMSKYLESIKELTFEVRRPTGYDASTGKYQLRPSTRFGNTVDMTQKVTLKDNESSLEVTSNGSPTMVEDNDVHFDDANFEKYILAKFDNNSNGKLSKAEAEMIRVINYNGRENGDANGNPAMIRNLHGIEAMINLERLDMNRVTLLDPSDANLSNNRKLRYIRFRFDGNDRSTTNGVKCLPNLSSLPALDSLIIYHHPFSDGNELSSSQFGGLDGIIDVSTLSHLKYLHLGGNRLTEVKGLDKLTRLEYLDLRGNKLTSINGNRQPSIDATALPRARIFVGQQYKYSSGKYIPLTNSDKWLILKVPAAYVYESSLISNGAKIEGTSEGSTDKTKHNYHVKVSKSGSLWNFIYQLSDRKLITFIAQNYNKKSNAKDGFTVDDCAKLFPGKDEGYIIASYLYRYELDEQKIVKETKLNLDGLGIKSLKGLEKLMPNLEELSCKNNSIEELDPSLFPKLTKLYCTDNRIVTLKCGENLTWLACSNNALASIDVSKATNLITLYCNNNALQELILSNNKKLSNLECQYNNLKMLDVSKCTSLNSLDCSYNSNMAYVGDVGDALWVALYVPKSITTLIARGIYANNGFSTLTIKLPKLTWLDMSDNPTITGYINTADVANRISHLDLHNTKITHLRSNQAALVYLDLSNSRYSGVKDVDGYNRLDVDMTKGWKKIGNLNVSDTKLDRVFITTSSSSTVPGVLYVGAPNRTTGIKVELQMDQFISAAWEQRWKWRQENKNVFAHTGNGTSWASTTSADMTMEGLTTNDETMRRNLGETLYERLKKRYAPTDKWLHASTVASQVKELDCSGMDITDINSIIKWMPNLERLNCSHNLITKANFSKLNNLKMLKIERNADLSSLTLPSNSPVVFDTLDVSDTKVKKSTVTNILNRCKVLLANGVESLTGTLCIYSSYPLTYLDVQHTNIDAAELYCPNLETFMAGYSPNLRTVTLYYGAKNFLVTCGGVNANVDVKLKYQGVLQKWFQYSAGNPINDHVSPSYQVTSKDGQTLWVPVSSVQGAQNLVNFCRNNLNKDMISINGKDVTLRVTSAQLTSWYANKYFEGNDNVHLEMYIKVAGAYKILPVTTVRGASNLAEMASKLTIASQLKANNGHITLTCNTREELNLWFDKYHEDNDGIVTVVWPLTFKDGKRKTAPVTKETIDARMNLADFCQKINSDQYTVTNYTDIALYLTDLEKKTWSGNPVMVMKVVRGVTKSKSPTNYSLGNEDIYIGNYADRPRPGSNEAVTKPAFTTGGAPVSKDVIKEVVKEAKKETLEPKTAVTTPSTPTPKPSNPAKDIITGAKATLTTPATSTTKPKVTLTPESGPKTTTTTPKTTTTTPKTTTTTPKTTTTTSKTTTTTPKTTTTTPKTTTTTPKTTTTTSKTTTTTSRTTTTTSRTTTQKFKMSKTTTTTPKTTTTTTTSTPKATTTTPRTTTTGTTKKVSESSRQKTSRIKK